MASGASSRDKVTIKIPRSLYQRLRAIVQDSGFDSVTDFVVYVLRDLVAAQAREEGDSTPLRAQEIQAIRQRLRNLGYL